MKKRLIVVLAVLATVVGMAFAADIKPLRDNAENTVFMAQTAEIEYTVTVTGKKKGNNKLKETKSFKVAATSASAAKAEAIELFKKYYPDYTVDVMAIACSSSNDSCYAF